MVLTYKGKGVNITNIDFGGGECYEKIEKNIICDLSGSDGAFYDGMFLEDGGDDGSRDNGG